MKAVFPADIERIMWPRPDAVTTDAVLRRAAQVLAKRYR